LPVGESINDIAHFELIVRLINLARVCRVLDAQTVDHKSTLFFGQKGSSFRGVMNRKWGYKCHNNRKKTLENEDPSPASISANTVHFLGIIRPISKTFIAVSEQSTYSDGVCKEPRECTRNTGGAEEESLSELCSVTWIPERNIVCHTRIQTSFYFVSFALISLDENKVLVGRGRHQHTCNAQKQTSCEKSTVIVNDTHQGLFATNPVLNAARDNPQITCALTITVPQAIMIKGSHLEGLSFFRSRLLGNSKTQ
jgi:hypothetical protein